MNHDLRIFSLSLSLSFRFRLRTGGSISLASWLAVPLQFVEVLVLILARPSSTSFLGFVAVPHGGFPFELLQRSPDRVFPFLDPFFIHSRLLDGPSGNAGMRKGSETEKKRNGNVSRASDALASPSVVVMIIKDDPWNLVCLGRSPGINCCESC